MLRRFVVLGATLVIGGHGGDAKASTAETQARLAAARPVATQAVSPPPSPVMPGKPVGGGEPVATAPKPDLPSPETPAAKPKPRQNLGPVLLIPALLVLVALVRWLARRRRSTLKRV